MSFEPKFGQFGNFCVKKSPIWRFGGGKSNLGPQIKQFGDLLPSDSQIGRFPINFNSHIETPSFLSIEFNGISHHHIRGFTLLTFLFFVRFLVDNISIAPIYSKNSLRKSFAFFAFFAKNSVSFSLFCKK